MVSGRSKCVSPPLSVRRTNRSRPVTARPNCQAPRPPATAPARSARLNVGSLIRVANRSFVPEIPHPVPGSRLGAPVLIEGFPAGSFAANCYVIAPGPGEDCLIIDPGQDAKPGIDEILAARKLRPVAVLATHGHLDHIWSVTPVCEAAGIPAYIHPADRALLSDPAKGFSALAGRQVFGGLKFTEPADVLELSDGMTLRLAGVSLVVGHAPGHTPGSVTF